MGGGAGGGVGKGCLERAVSREPSRDGVLEMVQVRWCRGGDSPGGRRGGRWCSKTVQARRRHSETVQVRWCRVGDGMGKVEMVWVRQSRMGDGAGREMVRDGRCRGG